MKHIEELYSYTDLALALAHCAYSSLYKFEAPSHRTVDNMCAGYLEAGTHILMHFKILKPIDEKYRRSVFICEPSEFRARIQQNKLENCSYDQMVSALLGFLYGCNNDELYEMLSPLGFCTKVLPKDRAHPSTTEIIWSEMCDKYKGLGYPRYETREMKSE